MFNLKLFNKKNKVNELQFVNLNGYQFKFNRYDEIFYYKKKKLDIWHILYPNVSRCSLSSGSSALQNAFYKILCPNCNSIFERRELSDMLFDCPLCKKEYLINHIKYPQFEAYKLYEGVLSTKEDIISNIKKIFEAPCGLLNISTIVSQQNFYSEKNKITEDEYINKYIEPLYKAGYNFDSKELKIYNHNLEYSNTLLYIKK